jgi:hypothetical protein
VRYKSYGKDVTPEKRKTKQRESNGTTPIQGERKKTKRETKR